MCAARPVIARDFSDLDFRSSLFYRAYLLPLAFLYPFVPFIQRPFVSRTLRLLPTTLSSNSSILALLAPGLSYVSLVGARIAALRRGIFVGFILENIWWLARGQRKLALSGNLRRQRGWLAPAVRLIYLFLVT